MTNLKLVVMIGILGCKTVSPAPWPVPIKIIHPSRQFFKDFICNLVGTVA